MSPDDGTTTGPVEGVVALPGDPRALEELIAIRRDHLAATIDELLVRGHPREIARRSAVDAKGRVQAFTTTPDGDLRAERLAAVAAAAAAFFGLLLLLRSRRGGAR
jgi:hypothetical protein